MKSPLFELTTGAALGSASVMGYFDRDSMAWGSTALAIQGGTDYFLQVKKTGSNFEWLLRDLGTDIEQTETTSDTRAAGVAQDPVALTDAQTGFLDMTLSHYVQVLNDDVADALTVKNWLLAKYAGDTTTSSTVTSSTTYQVFSKTPKIIPCRQQSTTMHSLDLQFVNPAGAVVKPLSGILEVLVKS